MKHRKSTYALLIFIVALLTYEQHLGLNALIIPLVLSMTHYFKYRQTLHIRWVLASILWVLSGLGICLWHLDAGLPLFLIAGLHYFAITYHCQIALPNSILQSVVSFFTGMGRFFLFEMKPIQTNSLTDNSKKILRIILLVAIPLTIFIIFLKLYQSANPEFAELTDFINLNFIEVPFLVYFGLLSIISYGLFYFRPVEQILELDLQKQENLEEENHHDLAKVSKQNFEWQIGLLVVSSLCLLLLAFIIIDANTVFGNANPHVNHSKNVHQSINILIASIVMVIIIILYLFRGQINFKASHWLKYLTYFWLALNGIVVLLILVKNSHYIGAWGLTNKRIGVYIYAVLCLIGIGFTVFKLYRNKTTSYLIERTSTTFLITLVCYGLINWNGLIVTYNLNEKNLAPDKVDLHYLAKLGPEVYPKLLPYIESKENIDQSLIFLIESKASSVKMSYANDWTYFLSYTYGGYQAYKQLQHRKFESSRSPYLMF